LTDDTPVTAHHFSQMTFSSVGVFFKGELQICQPTLYKTLYSW